MSPINNETSTVYIDRHFLDSMRTGYFQVDNMKLSGNSSSHFFLCWLSELNMSLKILIFLLCAAVGTTKADDNDLKLAPLPPLPDDYNDGPPPLPPLPDDYNNEPPPLPLPTQNDGPPSLPPLLDDYNDRPPPPPPLPDDYYDNFYDVPPPPPWTDYTDYRDHSMCGDVVTWFSWDCSCNNTIISPFYEFYEDLYCCVPEDQGQCYNPSDDSIGGVCPEGKPIYKDVPCNKKCYNDYNLSYHLYTKAHFYCVKDDSAFCLPIEKLCRGIEYCESDVEVCDEELRCMESNINTQDVRKASTKEVISTELVEKHNYCIRHTIANDNGVYNTIDRTDESKITNNEESVDFSLLKQCKDDGLSVDGISCRVETELTREKCKMNFEWCTNKNVEETRGCTLNENVTINVNDKSVCGNHTVWKNVSCNMYEPLLPGSIQIPVVDNYGLRCQGSFQHCYYPWYYRSSGGSQIFEATCYDQSHKKFEIGQTCLDFNKKFLNIHTEKFCNYKGSSTWYDFVKEKKICKNPTEWFQEQTDPLIQDPHECQDSCYVKGPDCQACTNPTYFNCTKSNVCIPGVNRCDGHPQCPSAEDELDCIEEYHKKGVIAKYATYKCKSAMYKGKILVKDICMFIQFLIFQMFGQLQLYATTS